MTVEAANRGAAPAPRHKSAPRGYFPASDLDMSVKVAEVIRNRAGGRTDRANLRAFLNYQTTRSGAFNARLASARLFGVIEGRGDDLSITPLGERIVAPTYEEDAKAARVDAFLSVPMFRKVYEFFDGRQLPPDSGLQNHLQKEHDIPEGQTRRVLRTLMNSAEQAHFFETPGGRSHMVKPLLGDEVGPPDAPEQVEHSQDEGAHEDLASAQPPPQSDSREQVRLEYVRKLVSQIGSGDHDQESLMDRIERLLDKEEER